MFTARQAGVGGHLFSMDNSVELAVLLNMPFEWTGGKRKCPNVVPLRIDLTRQQENKIFWDIAHSHLHPELQTISIGLQLTSDFSQR